MKAIDFPKAAAAMNLPRGMTLLRTVDVPVRLVSEANQREHWRARNRRKFNQQMGTHLMLVGAFHDFPSGTVKLPLFVKLTRIGPRRFDKDNNVGSFKHVQDAVAAFFGINDGDESRIGFEYAQELGKPSSLRIEIYGRVVAGGGGGGDRGRDKA